MISQAEINRTFTLIEAAALAGERCPMNTSNGGTLIAAAVRALCDQGRIRLEISGHNFRRAFILTGPHAGRATAPDPSGGEPYRRIPQDRDDYARKCIASRKEREARYRERVFA